MFAEQSLVMTPSTIVTSRLIIVVISEGRGRWRRRVSGDSGPCQESWSVCPCVCLDTDQGR